MMATLTRPLVLFIFCCLVLLVLANINFIDLGGRQNGDGEQQRRKDGGEFLRLTKLESELKEARGANDGLRQALQSCGVGRVKDCRKEFWKHDFYKRQAYDLNIELLKYVKDLPAATSRTVVISQNVKSDEEVRVDDPAFIVIRSNSARGRSVRGLRGLTCPST